jgi:acetone carboxylase gamma subunit
MTRRRISETLALDSGKIVCAQCSHALAAAGTAWKHKAALTTVALTSLPGAGSAVEARVVLRRFACPGCGSLLDTETAMPEDPFLDDLVWV